MFRHSDYDIIIIRRIMHFQRDKMKPFWDKPCWDGQNDTILTMREETFLDCIESDVLGLILNRRAKMSGVEYMRLAFITSFKKIFCKFLSVPNRELTKICHQLFVSVLLVLICSLFFDFFSFSQTYKSKMSKRPTISLVLFSLSLSEPVFPLFHCISSIEQNQ